METLKKGYLILLLVLILALGYAVFYFYDLDDYLPSISGIVSLGWVVQAVEAGGYIGLIVLMTMESASLPVPSEVILPLEGYLVYQGRTDFWLAFVASLAGSIIGSAVDYALGLKLGKSVTKLPLINERSLKTATDWFQRRGPIVVLLARFVIGLRALISIPAGMFAMSKKKFLAYTLAGSAIWNASLIYAGLTLGSRWEIVSAWVNKYLIPISIVVIAAIILYVGVKLFKRRSHAFHQNPISATGQP
ncbi:MAG TPA: DedA family protein [Thermoprotei archaeon]|nr:DedA family protein [TACK group archaeon]HEV51207.1 DedA family protein [Thermoprotei archaeon]